MTRRESDLARLQVEQFDERRRELVATSWEKGMAISQIAELVGLSRPAVLAILEGRDPPALTWRGSRTIPKARPG